MYSLNLDSGEHLAMYLDASLRFPRSRQILAKGYYRDAVFQYYTTLGQH